MSNKLDFPEHRNIKGMKNETLKYVFQKLDELEDRIQSLELENELEKTQQKSKVMANGEEE